MAILRARSGEDFKQMVRANCKPKTHMAVTDNATYIVMVPVVTSQHRHYIILESVETEVKPIVDWLRKSGYTVVEGEVEFKTT